MPDKELTSRKKFIRLGAAVGLGSAAVPLVSACGGGPAGGGGAPEAGGAFPFTDAETGQQGVLVRLKGGKFASYSAICAHQACTVAYQPQTRKLACPCHGSVFDPARKAAVETGPAQRPLPGAPVRVEGGEVVRV